VQIRLFMWLRSSQNQEVKDRTLTKVSLYLDSILVDRDRLTRDKSALVAGLLESHKVFSWQKQPTTESATRDEARTSLFGNLAWKPRGHMSSHRGSICANLERGSTTN
jgi:hypothetical protein